MEFGISLAMLRSMVKEAHHHNNSHIPVLLDAVIQCLKPKPGESYLDLTAGYGGHASKVLSMTGNPKGATLVDRDQNAIAALQQFAQAGARLVHQDFASATQQLTANREQFDMILIDLGVSSPHLDNSERGFSFKTEAPLDMRMDTRQQLTAEHIVNTYSEEELTIILKSYGEEPKAKKIAKAIIDARPLTTTLELAHIVEKFYGRKGKTHPATRTFQALRIAVNEELTQLDSVLPLLPQLLKKGGRVAIISFHSLEDRLVKSFFASETQAGYEARLQVLTKKPIHGAHEDVLNRRARSAKLRAAIKINT